MKPMRTLGQLGLLAIVVAWCAPAAIGAGSSVETVKSRYAVTEKIEIRYAGSYEGDADDVGLHVHIVPTFGEVRVPIWNRYVGRGSVHVGRGRVAAEPLSVPGEYEVRLVAMQRTHMGMQVIAVLARSRFVVESGWPDYPYWTRKEIQFVRGVELFEPHVDPGPGRHCWSHVLSEKHTPQHGRDHRLLLVFGPDILRSAGPVIEDDDHLQYRKLYRGRIGDDAFQEEFAGLIDYLDQRWSVRWKGRRQTDDILEDDVVLLSIEVGKGAPAGLQTVQFDARADRLPAVHWMLREANNPGALYFSRIASTAEFTGISSVFVYDRIRIELDARYPVEADTIHVDVGLDGRPASVDGQADSVIELVRVPGTKRCFSSAPLALIATNTPASRLPAGLRCVRVEPGKILNAFVHPFGPVRVRNAAHARVYSSPAHAEGLWLEALVDAARSAEIDPDAHDLKTARGRLELALLPVVVDAAIGEIPAKVGDVAAMLLLRRSFVASVERVKEKMLDIREQAKKQRAYLHGFRELIRPLAQAPDSPFGALDVVAAKGVMADMHVAFWHVYDETYLRRRFGGLTSNQFAWQDQATAELLDIYIAAIDEALEHARKIKDEDWRGLLELTGMHFEPVRDRVLSNLLRLNEDPKSRTLMWIPDGIARVHLENVAPLGAKLREREDLAEALQTMALIAASLVVMAPEILIVRALSFGVSAVSFAAAVGLRVPEFIDRRGKVRRALGAVEILGQRRLEDAQARAIPWYMLALDLTMSVASVAGDALAVCRLGRASLVVRKVPQYVELLDDFKALDRLTDRQKEVVVFVAGEAKRLQQGISLATDSVLFPFVTPGFKEALLRLGPRLERFQGVLWRAERPYICAARIPRAGAYTMRPGESIDGLMVSRGIGRGRSAQVYSLADYEADALKLLSGSLTDDEARATLGRIRQTARLLDGAGIQHLKVKRLVPRATTGRSHPYWIQERLPQGAKVYRYAHREISYEFLGKTRTRDMPFGVHEFDGRPLPREQQRALAGLLRKMYRNGLAYEDGHLANFYFEKVDGTWRAGVLDLERIVPMDGDFTRLLNSTESGAFREMQLSPGLETDIYRNSIRSLRDCTLPDDAFERLTAGRHIYPDAEFFMTKMLEYKWMIRYDRSTGRWMDSVLEMDIVAEYFPAVRRHIDMDFR